MGRQERHQPHLGRGEARALAVVEHGHGVERLAATLSVCSTSTPEIGTSIEDVVDLRQKSLAERDVAKRDECPRELESRLHGEPGNRVGQERSELLGAGRAARARRPSCPDEAAIVPPRQTRSQPAPRRRACPPASSSASSSACLSEAAMVVRLLGEEHALAGRDDLRLAEADPSRMRDRLAEDLVRPLVVAEQRVGGGIDEQRRDPPLARLRQSGDAPTRRRRASCPTPSRQSEARMTATCADSSGIVAAAPLRDASSQRSASADGSAQRVDARAVHRNRRIAARARRSSNWLEPELDGRRRGRCSRSEGRSSRRCARRDRCRRLRARARAPTPGRRAARTNPPRARPAPRRAPARSRTAPGAGDRGRGGGSGTTIAVLVERNEEEIRALQRLELLERVARARASRRRAHRTSSRAPTCAAGTSAAPGVSPARYSEWK